MLLRLDPVQYAVTMNDTAQTPDTQEFAAFRGVREHLVSRVIGQQLLVERMLVALLADGHLLVEGAPGLAKTSAIKTLAQCVDGSFHRIQFTPDLLPSDLTGTDVYRPADGSFQFQAGPIFNNLLLADEINRAPAKVQSALLEAMEERQVTVGKTSRPLPDPFLVMATQNPIEQEGTYPLPEAQLDRFMLHVEVGHPAADVEHEILRLNRSLAQSQLSQDEPSVATALDASTIRTARQHVLGVHMSDELEKYLVNLVIATREPKTHVPDLDGMLRLGASPRATLSLDRVARASAWLDGRDFVTPPDIQNLAADVLRHRLLLSFEADAGGVSSSDVVAAIVEAVPVP